MPKGGSWKIQREIRFDMYDVVIIGAGPAGATFARLAPEKLKIAIIDKRNLGENENFIRPKCCGGLLAPAAQRELAEQGLGVPENVLAGPQTFSVKSMDFDNNLVRFYQRHYINIYRGKFDRWLVSLIPPGVDSFFGCIFKSCSYKDQIFTIKFRDAEKDLEIKAKYLVAADGAASMPRSIIAPDRRVPDKYVSIQDTYKKGQILPYYFSIFDKETTDFYSWMIQKDNKVLFGSAIPWGENVIEKHNSLSEKLIQGGYIEGEVLKRSGAVIYRPGSIRSILLCRDNVFFVGEASGMISPSSAEGISYAMKSGRKLAESFVYEDNIKKKYRTSMISMKLNIIYKNIKSAIMYNRFLRKIIMISGIMSIDVKDD